MTDKEIKKARSNFQRLTMHIRSCWATNKIKTCRDFLVRGIGYEESYCKNVLHLREDELSKVLTFADVKDKIEDLRISFETDLWLKNNPPNLKEDETTYTTTDDKNTAQCAVSIPEQELAEATRIIEQDLDYGLKPSEKEKAFLFWFQKKYAKAVLDKLINDKLRAVLLIAQAGAGKTFILGAVFRRLLDMKYHEGKTIAPWPYCYITKSSVVEQSKRVLENYFSIDTTNECFITNYDQMRSKFGQLFVFEKTTVISGVEDFKWTWRNMLYPIVFFVDESQAAKNEDSTQSKIVCSIAEIDSKDVRVVFSSATPFTRVSEAKYFVLNCRIDSHLY